MGDADLPLPLATLAQTHECDVSEEGIEAPPQLTRPLPDTNLLADLDSARLRRGEDRRQDP
jgi:hypothetical protein